MPMVRFFIDRKASVAPLLALAAIPLFSSVGTAVDFSRASSARVAMQAALDSTAIMLAKQARQSGSTPSNQNATVYFNANFDRPDVQGLQVTVASSSASGGTALALTATATINTEFMGLAGIPTLNLSVQSGVVATADGLGCVLSLDPNASGAVTGQGSTTVNLNGCSLYDNSKNASALTVGGSANISALSVGVVGGISGNTSITTTLGIQTGIGPVLDPYADAYFPNFSGCKETKFTAKNKITIDPGVYCGGISLNAGADVTLNSGIYYLDGGGLTVNGGAKLTGTGVTLVFTKKSSSDWATATINGNATVNLTPPISGPTAGIVVFGDRNIPLNTSFKFNGGATQYLGGATYVPTGAVSYSGGAGTSTSCTQIIGNTVTFTGNSSVAINCSGYEIKPFSPNVIRLTS